MGWREQQITILGSGDHDAARAIQDTIWNEIASPLWYSRCKEDRPHHRSLVQSDYAFDYVRPECRPAPGGFHLVWRLSDTGPHHLFAHWIELALAYRREMIAALVQNRSFHISGFLPDIDEILLKKRTTFFIDTADRLLMVSQELPEHHDDLTVWFGLARRLQHASIATFPAQTRRAIHRVLDSGRCDCFVCHDLYLNLDD